MTRAVTKQSHVVISERKKQAFLKSLAKTGRVKIAARAAGYTDTRHLRRLRQEDEDFANQWDEALASAADTLEDEAVRRATEGVEEPVFYKGRVVGHKVNYSDQLMMFLLKGMRPEKYRDSYSGAGVGQAFNLAVLPIAYPSTEQWEEVAGKVMDAQPAQGSMRVIDVEPENGSKVERS